LTYCFFCVQSKRIKKVVFLKEYFESNNLTSLILLFILMFPFFEGEVQLLAYDVIVTNLPPIDTKYVLSMCLVSIFPTAAAHLPRDFQRENNKLGVVASKRHTSAKSPPQFQTLA
jgi:hypothetical protein